MIAEKFGESQSPSPREPLVCRRCGAITYPVVTPGTGPHAYKSKCPYRGGFMRWLSKYSPEKQAARREQARQEAMAQRPPSAAQLSLLQMLGDTNPPPANMREASERITALRRARVA